MWRLVAVVILTSLLSSSKLWCPSTGWLKKLLILCGYVNEKWEDRSREQIWTTTEKMKHCVIFSLEIFLSVFSMLKYAMTESSQCMNNNYHERGKHPFEKMFYLCSFVLNHSLKTHVICYFLCHKWSCFAEISTRVYSLLFWATL